jgi:hypothetical protein
VLHILWSNNNRKKQKKNAAISTFFSFSSPGQTVVSLFVNIPEIAVWFNETTSASKRTPCSGQHCASHNGVYNLLKKSSHFCFAASDVKSKWFDGTVYKEPTFIVQLSVEQTASEHWTWKREVKIFQTIHLFEKLRILSTCSFTYNRTNI